MPPRRASSPGAGKSAPADPQRRLRQSAGSFGDSVDRSFRASRVGSGAGGTVDCAADGVVGPAAADVSAHGFVDITVGGMAGLAEQRDRRHDLAGLAVAALRHVFLDPRLLYGAGVLFR